MFVRHQSLLRTELPCSVMKDQQVVPEVPKRKDEDELQHHVRVMIIAVVNSNVLAQDPLGELFSMITNDEELGYVLCLWRDFTR